MNMIKPSRDYSTGRIKFRKGCCVEFMVNSCRRIWKHGQTEKLRKLIYKSCLRAGHMPGSRQLTHSKLNGVLKGFWSHKALFGHFL